MTSTLKDIHGPDWPLGLIIVPTPRTPVPIMSLVDSTSLNDPNSSNRTGLTVEFTIRCNQIRIQGLRAGAAHGLRDNQGNIYVVRYGGSSDDTGTIVVCVKPGITEYIAAAPMTRDVFSPYRYYIDADNANDAGLVTLFIF